MRKPGTRGSLDMERLTSEPLLNEEQRVALDAALAKKRAEQREWRDLFAGRDTPLAPSLPCLLLLPFNRRPCADTLTPAPCAFLPRPPSRCAAVTVAVIVSGAPAGDGGDAGVEGGKPQVGSKLAFVEAPKTKRELAHDHHLSRRGKGKNARPAAYDERCAASCPPCRPG